jgi:hypothetical protein
MKRLALSIAMTMSLAGIASAQHLHDPAAHGSAGHAMHASTTADAGAAGDPSAVTQGGQAAFAAIQEIVDALMADPRTDWSRVDVEALRRHLIDMDNVTLRSDVEALPVDDGARFLVTASDPDVVASIRSMVSAHVATMDGVEGWAMRAEEIPDGAAMTVTGDPVRIRALGFIGLMTVGMHHQEPPLALAKGADPHRH